MTNTFTLSEKCHLQSKLTQGGNSSPLFFEPGNSLRADLDSAYPIQ